MTPRSPRARQPRRAHPTGSGANAPPSGDADRSTRPPGLRSRPLDHLSRVEHLHRLIERRHPDQESPRPYATRGDDARPLPVGLDLRPAARDPAARRRRRNAQADSTGNRVRRALALATGPAQPLAHEPGRVAARHDPPPAPLTSPDPPAD